MCHRWTLKYKATSFALGTFYFCLRLLIVASYPKHIERFSHPEIQHYKQLLFDVPNVKLLVGARDYIVTLNLDDFDSQFKRVYYIPSDQAKQYTCQIKGMPKEQCHNFITAILPIPSSTYSEKQILVCGTNAYSPECEIRPLNSLDTVTNRSAPINSYSPLWNTTSLITSSGEFFYGGPLDFRGIDSSITRQQISLNSASYSRTDSPRDKRIIRSAQHDSKWINSDANFVHSFEYQNHVYFLFRESAVEYLNCGKRIYSRVGRVCKNDPGIRENWTSFLKTRLNCSIPGLFPFYFDQIQAVDWVEGSGTPTLYAIFNTPENSIHGSAVCAFSVNSIVDAFQGPFKHQKSSSHVWESVNDKKEIFECGVSSANYSENNNNLRLNSMYQLMDNSVQALLEKPYVISKEEHFKFISVDLIKTKFYESVEIIFIATADGKLLKYVQWPYLIESCLVDEIQLINPKQDQILSMKFLKDTQSLYIGSEKEILRVSVHRCHIHHSKEACLSSGDPYCGWNENKLKCVTAPGNNHKSDQWIQSKISACANGHWNKWFQCSLNEGVGELCKCRKRKCTSNSISCIDGFETQVANCTQNGGWSQWSDWSTCFPSCGKGEQYRARTCTNPVPSFGGQPCLGENREVRECIELPSCNWGPWSIWSNCSKICTPESQRRSRRCFDFEGNLMDDKFCIGQPIETATCDNCKKLDWSDWFITEINRHGVIEQRNEIVTRQNILPKNEKRVMSLKYCQKCDGYTYQFKERQYLIKECSCDGNQEWSDWSEWSDCVNGTQDRYRSCLLEEKQCNGHHQEIRLCGKMKASSSMLNVGTLVQGSQSREGAFVFLCVAVSTIVSSCLTWAVAVVVNRRKNINSTLGLVKHNSEPNTYEEPVQLLINGHSKPERTSTLKRDFKHTSFHAKMDDNNYS